MTIKGIQDRLYQELAHLYDADEIQAVFRYYVEIRFNILDSYLFNDDVAEFNAPFFEQDVEELKQGKPVQQVVGFAFFYDYFFKVNESTLIPRPETEELIYLITEKYDRNAPLKVIDLGTGSGCIPITINKLFPNATVHAIDISKEALAVARYNNKQLNTNVKFFEQDLLKEFTLENQYDIIISNPPYIRELEKKEMHINVLNHEPHLALFVSDDDPLIFYRRVSQIATQHLKQQGKIFCEINQYLGPETKALFQENFNSVEIHQDISGNDRILEASF